MDWEKEASNITTAQNIDWEKLGSPTTFNETPSFEPSPEISTITGKHIMKPADTNYTPADFVTLVKAGVVTTDKAKIDIFSKARGISKDRYQVNGGKIWFKGQDGKMYPETPKELTNIVKKMIADIPSDLLVDAPTALGAYTGGVTGAATGAAIGRGIKQKIASHFFGDNPSTTKQVIDMSLNAALGAVDAGTGKLLSKRLQTKKLRKEAGIGSSADDIITIAKELTPSQKGGAAITKQKGKDIGVDLLPHQTLDSQGLTDYYKLLRNSPRTNKVIKELDDKLEQQIFQASNDLVANINSGRNIESSAIKDDLATLAQQAIDKMKVVRGGSVKDLYKKAYKVNTVDVTAALDKISDLQSKLKPEMSAYKGLNRIKKMLVSEKKIPESKILDASGVPFSPASIKQIKEKRIEILDNIKQEIDLILQGRGEDAVHSKMRGKFNKLKDVLTEQTDLKSREYQIARALFTAASPKIERTKKSIVGVLSRMDTDAVKETALKKIFATPQSIKQAKKYLQKESPEAWEDAISEYFKESFINATNIGNKSLSNKYTGKMWNLIDKKKLEIATKGMVDGNGKPLFKTINDFFDVMKSASIGQSNKTQRKTKGQLTKELQGIPGKLSASVVFFKQTMANVFLKARQEKAFNKNAKKLLSLLQTPEGIELLSQVKGYGPKTQEGITAATTLLLMSSESKASDLKDITQGLKENNK